MGHVTSSLDQTDFRFRNDDGSESAATWIAATNTNATISVDTNFRIRLAVTEQNNASENNVNFQLQYNLNSAGWNNVTGSSTVVQAVLSSNVADEEATTQQITSGTFLVGAIDEADGIAGGNNQIDFVGNDVTELEFVVQILSADVANNDTIQLRVIRSGGSLEAHTQVPTATVSELTNEIIPIDLASLTLDDTLAHDIDQTVQVDLASLTLDDTLSHAIVLTIQVDTASLSLDDTLNHTVLFNEIVTIDLASLSLDDTLTQNINLTLPVSTASLTLTPNTAQINEAIKPNTPSLTLTGNDANVNQTVEVTTASLTLTANDAQTNLTIPIALGSLSLDDTLNHFVLADEIVTIDLASLTLTGNDVNLNETIPASTASLSLTGNSTDINQNIQPNTASLTLTGNDANISLALPVNTASLSLDDTLDHTITDTGGGADEFIAIDLASLTLTANTAQINETIPVSTASLTLTGNSTNINEAITPNAASLTLTGQSPSVNQIVDVSTASLSLDDTLNHQISIPVDIPVDTASLTLTSNAAQINEAIKPTLGTLSLTGNDHVINERTNITVTLGSLTLDNSLFAKINLTIPITTASIALDSTFEHNIVLFKPKNNFYAKTIGSNGFFVNVGGNIVLDWREDGRFASGKIPEFFFEEDDRDTDTFEVNKGMAWPNVNTTTSINNVTNGTKVT